MRPMPNRREFLATVGGGLALAVTHTGCRKVDSTAQGGRAPELTITPVAYVRLDDLGQVTIVCHRSEMGQGIRTTLPMIIADEMEADWSRVRVEQADGDDKLYASQNTDGSTSISAQIDVLRQAGATMRQLLEAAAAAHWSVPVAEVEARAHQVIHQPTGRSVGYGALVERAQGLPLPDQQQLRFKEPAAYRYVGKAMPGVDLDDMITGRAIYGQDLRREGMKYAVIARPPVYGATLTSFDASEAERVPGVERVIRLPEAAPPMGFTPLGGVAVVARNTWAALEGRKRLKLTWDEGRHARYDSDQFRAQIEATAQRAGKPARIQGDVAAALTRAARRVSADYYAPHLAHAPMEPPAALAVVENGKVEAWAPTQDPMAARQTLAKVLDVPIEQTTVHVTLLGGAFGRKSKPDFIAEAALLARDMAAPVKVVWTREDDIQHDYFHTVTAQHLEAGLDESGRVTAWLHRTVLPSIAGLFESGVRYAAPWEMGMGITDFPYDIPNYRGETGPADSETRIGWYRSVINIPHAFAIGSFIDELAHAAGKDPRDFLLALLGPDRIVDLERAGIQGDPWNYGQSFQDHPVDIARYRQLVELVTDRARWGTPLPKGRGRGLAVHRSFLSYVAVVLEVEVGGDGAVTIPRADIAIDAGFVANPDRVRAQMEGALVMGIGNALLSEVSFSRGRPVQSNFSDYLVPRLGHAPRETHVHLMPSTRRPGGVGEPGVPPVAPALCNAIFAATGKRIRRLPVGTQLAGGAA